MDDHGPGFQQIRTGVDLAEVNRIVSLCERYGDRFFTRVFTTRELEVCKGRPDRLAARFAAKEAVSKALGTGIGQVSWREIEIVSDSTGRPQVRLAGRAARLAAELGLHKWSVSLSHTKELAIAFVIAAG